MDTATFIIQAGYGEESSVRNAASENPALTAAHSESGISVIASTVYAGRLALARELASHRDDLDLFEAACLGEQLRVSELVERDPGVLDTFSPDGFSVLGLAAFFGHLDLLSMLLELGASLEAPARNPMRVRPLHSAVAHGDPEIAFEAARRLLKAGANPNILQQGGMTPLHEAVYNANFELVDLLLDHGANPHLSNDEGDSPLQLSQARGEAEITSRMAAVRVD